MITENILWGGQFQKLLTKFKLDRDPDSVVIRKIVFFSVFTWVPLLILSVLQSSVFNPGLKVSLLTDIVVWARFFIAMPILFYTERLLKHEVGRSVAHLIDSGIISENNHDDYEKIILKICRIRDSKFAELIIFAVAYCVVFFYWRASGETEMASSWQFQHGKELSPAGFWYYYISAPIFQFLLYRLLFKFLLWVGFLYKISRIDLNLIPINPDLSGGLSFLGVTTAFFGFIGLAQGCVVSAQIAEFIVKNNVPLTDFKVTIFTNIIVLLLLFLFPMIFFIRKLTRVRFDGLLEYGVVSQKYVNSFNNKWVKNINPQNEQLLGSADIQSLADLFNSFQIVAKMSVFPFTFKQIIYLAVLIAIPFIPLIFFIISPAELLKYLVEMFL
jgi:hypothetical protein